MKNLTLKSVGSWLDENVLFVLAAFLIFFIPVYPKLPLFDIIPGYIVRVRIEDFVVLFTGIIWLVQLYRKKITWKTPLTWIIGAYAVTGILSTLSALFITDTVPVELLHAGKTILHFCRYMEYFFLFFLLIETVRSKLNIKILFSIFLISVVAISLYGYGQRYFYWPVYSTMNREFSKGMTLYLTPHARVQSTFGGHYDLGAYLVITLPIILSAVYIFKKKWQKLLLLLVFAGGMWALIEAGSRASFVGFVAGSLIVIGIFAAKQTKWWKKLLKFTTDSLVLFLVMMTLLFQFGDDIYERFLQLIRPYPALIQTYDYWNDQRKKAVIATADFILSRENQDKMQNALSAKPPENALPAITSENGDTVPVMVASDEQPTDKPPDVITDIPDKQMEAVTDENGNVTIQEVDKAREYSRAAQIFGLSLGIRYDTLWPRAIAGFEKNPLLGSGYATLTKESEYQFTEAESTDNNFLRTLGETGLLGFITFYGAVFIALKIAWKLLKSKDADEYSFVFAIGFIAGTIGLLLNAIYIDVFASSKVAFTFWALAGIVCGAYLLKPKKPAVEPALGTSHSSTVSKRTKSARNK